MSDKSLNLNPIREALASAIKTKELNRKFIESIGPSIIEALAPILEEMARSSQMNKEDMIEAVKNIQINIPEITVPQAMVSVDVPEIKLPVINVPKPEVTVNVPEIKIPTINVPAPMVNVTTPEIDFSPIIKAINDSKVEKNDDGPMLVALEAISQELKAMRKEPVKIDSMQMREISSSRSNGGAISLASGPSTNGLVYDGRKVVAVTDTAVRLSADKYCEEVFITALTTNTDVIVIGGPGVIFTEATRTGRAMNPGDSIVLKIHNLKDVWLNGTANDGVSFTYTS